MDRARSAEVHVERGVQRLRGLLNVRAVFREPRLDRVGSQSRQRGGGFELGDEFLSDLLVRRLFKRTE